MQTCPCGQNRPLEACCGPFLEGQSQPETAEQLMRSRFSAYATGNIDYVCETEENPNRDTIENWAGSTSFKRLRVLSTEKGGAEDETGTVTFEADFETKGQPGTHRETSQFRKVEGRWIFVRGQHNPLRIGPKVGRNDPCACGSGKKFKKCCLGKDSDAPQ